MKILGVCLLVKNDDFTIDNFVKAVALNRCIQFYNRH